VIGLIEKGLKNNARHPIGLIDH